MYSRITSVSFCDLIVESTGSCMKSVRSRGRPCTTPKQQPRRATVLHCPLAPLEMCAESNPSTPFHLPNPPTARCVYMPIIKMLNQINARFLKSEKEGRVRRQGVGKRVAGRGHGWGVEGRGAEGRGGRHGVVCTRKAACGPSGVNRTCYSPLLTRRLK